MFGIFKRRPKPKPPLPLTSDHLVGVFRSFHAVAAAHAIDLDAAGIMDEILLPFPKVEILEVLCVYLTMEEQGRDHERVAALVADLASFQPGLGAQPVFPKEEGLRRLATGPMNAKVFTEAYDLMEAEAERYSRLQTLVLADLRAIADRCGGKSHCLQNGLVVEHAHATDPLAAVRIERAPKERKRAHGRPE